MITLSHALARDYIQQQADGETLRAEARQALQHHLAECPECRAYAEDIQALHLTLARAFRTRWEHQPLPPRARPLAYRPAARTWSPLAQMMVMVTMTFLALSLLPEWSRVRGGPPTPLPTATQSVSISAPRPVDVMPDEGLDNLTSLEIPATVPMMKQQAEPLETDAHQLNDPDQRAARAQ